MGPFLTVSEKRKELLVYPKRQLLENNSLDTNSYRLERTPIKRGKYDFLVHDKVFSSTFDVISAELADTDNQVRERCRSNSIKWKNWKMVQKKRSNDYPEKE